MHDLHDICPTQSSAHRSKAHRSPKKKTHTTLMLNNRNIRTNPHLPRSVTETILRNDSIRINEQQNLSHPHVAAMCSPRAVPALRRTLCDRKRERLVLQRRRRRRIVRVVTKISRDRRGRLVVVVKVRRRPAAGRCVRARYTQQREIRHELSRNRRGRRRVPRRSRAVVLHRIPRLMFDLLLVLDQFSQMPFSLERQRETLRTTQLHCTSHGQGGTNDLP